MKFKKTIAIDFDGVLNQYKGYDPKNLYEMRSGAREFLEELNKNYEIKIYSSREPHSIRIWLKHNQLEHLIKDISKDKPPAIAYIDDRAIRFNGDYTEILEKVEEKTYWEKELQKRKEEQQ